MTSWTIRLPYPRLPLSLNDRSHWAVVARAKRTLRDQVRWHLRSMRVPRCERIHVQVEWTPATRRTRDEDNLMLVHKICVDGCRDYAPTKRDPAGWTGIVPDDDPQHVSWSPPIIHPPAKDVTERLVITIEDRSNEVLYSEDRCEWCRKVVDCCGNCGCVS